MADNERSFEEHLLEDVHTIARQVHEMHTMFEKLRPLLAMFEPNGGASDLQRAGLARTVRKAARRGGQPH